MENQDDIALIDLAVAFFAAVVVIFAFVEFNVSDVPESKPQASIGQEESWMAAQPATWQPVNQRGGFGYYDGEALVILDMVGLGAGVVDPLESYVDPVNGLTWFPGSAEAPNAFRVAVRFHPETHPVAWRRGEILDPGVQIEGECLDFPAALLTVFVPNEVVDLAPLAGLATRCQLRMRYEFITAPRSEDRPVSFAIDLEPSDFQRERMFR